MSGRYTDADERNDNSGRTWPTAPSRDDAPEAVGLLPCPFCGEKPFADSKASRTIIACQNEQCIIWTPTPAPFNDYTHKADATSAWNRRALSPPPVHAGEAVCQCVYCRDLGATELCRGYGDHPSSGEDVEGLRRLLAQQIDRAFPDAILSERVKATDAILAALSNRGKS